MCRAISEWVEDGILILMKFTIIPEIAQAQYCVPNLYISEGTLCE